MPNSVHDVYTADGPCKERAVKVSGRKGSGKAGSSQSASSSMPGTGSSTPEQSQIENAALGSMPVVNQLNVATGPDGTIGINVPVADATPETGPGASRSGSTAPADTRGSKAVGVQTGWVQLGNGFKYYKEDGSGYKTGWHFENHVDGTKIWYYFDTDPNNKEWMVTGWKKIIGERGEYWYYFRIDGKMSIYWEVLDKMWYYLEPVNDGGCMIMGWKMINANWYYFIPEQDAGYMMIDWLEIEDKWYYFYNSDNQRGIMAANHMVNHTDGKQYYLGSDGAMIISKTFESEEDGKTYIADENGVCSEVDNASSRVERILENIMSDTTLGLTSEQKTTIAVMGRVLLNEDYKEAFVAGVLANIISEASAGYFESSNYKSKPSEKPSYLVYMDNNYGYRGKYSGTCITSHSLSTVFDLLVKLEKDSWKKGKFGLGCVQWTAERTKTLVEKYQEVAGVKDRISLEQVLTAECRMILYELRNVPDYKVIYPNWKSRFASNLDSGDAAYRAGYDICLNYEMPKNKESKALARGEIAEKLYGVMMATL